MSHSPADAFTPGISRSPFQPAWWLNNPHLQTLYPPMFRQVATPGRVRERVTLSDGDWLYLDWRLPKSWMGKRQPLVVIVHGLTGNSQSQYVLGLQHALDAIGWASVAMNCRGATGEANDRPRAYHAGAHDDLADVMRLVRERYTDVPLALVGYSLGGAISLNYLALEKPPERLFAAVAVSVPLLLGACADRLDQGFSRVYRKHLLAELCKAWERKAGRLQALGDEEMAAHIRERLAQGPFTSFRTFDDVLVASLHGFRDGEDYYTRCSPRQRLGDITVPTLLLQAADDPFLAPECFPSARELSATVQLEISPRGGHVGFVEAGSSWREPIYYLERRIPQFLQAMAPESVRVAKLADSLPPAYQSSSMRKAAP
ncbi:hydrolase [Amnimonas aquatica]|uniref:hydrolase n=1 Tax=Amnimonas aquatica TaxID=2094561 RepID=UPI0019D1FADD|nr:hydrolase [Amnimonas aquatica]